MNVKLIISLLFLGLALSRANPVPEGTLIDDIQTEEKEKVNVEEDLKENSNTERVKKAAEPSFLYDTLHGGRPMKIVKYSNPYELPQQQQATFEQIPVTGHGPTEWYVAPGPAPTPQTIEVVEESPAGLTHETSGHMVDCTFCGKPRKPHVLCGCVKVAPEPPTVECEPRVIPAPEPPVVKCSPVPEPPVVKCSPVPEPPVVKCSPVPEPPVAKCFPIPQPPVVKCFPVPQPPVVKCLPVPEPPKDTVHCVKCIHCVRCQHSVQCEPMSAPAQPSTTCHGSQSPCSMPCSPYAPHIPFPQPCNCQYPQHWYNFPQVPYIPTAHTSSLPVDASRQSMTPCSQNQRQ